MSGTSVHDVVTSTEISFGELNLPDELESPVTVSTVLLLFKKPKGI